MNAGQIRVKILLLQLIDWSMLIGAFGIGAYTIFYAEYVELMAIVTLMALYLVSVFGQASLNKIAALRMDLELLKRDKPK